MNVQDIINRRDKEAETAARWTFAADEGNKAFEDFLTQDRIATIKAIEDMVEELVGANLPDVSGLEYCNGCEDTLEDVLTRLKEQSPP